MTDKTPNTAAIADGLISECGFQIAERGKVIATFETMEEYASALSNLTGAYSTIANLEAKLAAAEAMVAGKERYIVELEENRIAAEARTVISAAIKDRISELEDMAGSASISPAALFTQMRQLIAAAPCMVPTYAGMLTDELAIFEREMLRLDIIDDEGLTKNQKGEYVDDAAASAWNAWQARAILAASTPPADANVVTVPAGLLTNDQIDAIWTCCPECHARDSSEDFLSKHEQCTIRFAAEALEGLEYEDTAGELRAILAVRKST